MYTFRRSERISRPKKDGSRGFVDVKKGDAPEQHNLDPDEYRTFLVMEDGSSPDALAKTVDEAVHCLWAMTPATTHPDLWTVDGAPEKKALEDIMCTKITEAQRDSAWDKFKKEVNDNE